MLSQQLELSRELSQKIKKPGEESTDEADSDDEGAAPHPDLDVAEDEPKLDKAGEISNFLSGYRKFWGQKNKEATKASPKKGSGTDTQQIVKTVEVADENPGVEEDEQLELMEELIELRQTQEQVLKKNKVAARPEDLSDKKKAKKRKSSSGGWQVVEKGKNVIDLFDKLEQKQEQLIQKSIDRLKTRAEAVENGTEKVVAKPESKKAKRKARLGGDKVRMSDVHIANSESMSKEPQNEPSRDEGEKRIDNMQDEEPAPKAVNIDPTKFLKPTALKSMQGEMVVVGGEDLDEERRDGLQKEVLAQLFADDDLVEEFR
jgi:hypothetical protein